MCGIFAFYSKNVVLDDAVIMDAMNLTSLRGKDGYGYVLNGDIVKDVKPDIDEIKEFPINSWMILNCRAKPETEVESSIRNLQPVWSRHNNFEYALVHNGAISEEFKNNIISRTKHKPWSDIDSEALLAMYINGLCNSFGLSKVNGGFSFAAIKYSGSKLIDITTATKYHPLWVICAEKCEQSFIAYSSSSDVIQLLLKHYTTREFHVQVQEVPPGTMISYSPITGYNVTKRFTPYYEYPNQAQTENKIKVLCSCSGGIDSTTSLIMAHKILKTIGSNFDIDLVHYKYGHRGQDAEETAVNNIVKILKEKSINVTLKVLDLESVYKTFFNVQRSQLINKDLEVETGTQDKLKSTIAWVPVRNMLFQTLMYGLAETYILEQGYKHVFIVAGWNQLSEEGFYPDNSGRFSAAMTNASQFGTLVSNQISNWNICGRLLKSDQWLLAKTFNFLDVFEHTISCDIPVKDGDMHYNCNGQCGSTLLSMWAAKRYKGIKDPRTLKDAVVTIDKERLYKFPTCEPIEITIDEMRKVMDRIVMPTELNEESLIEHMLNERENI